MAGFAGWLYVRNVTPMYKSTARIFVDRAGPVIVSKSIDQDMLLQANNFRRTQAEIIKSVSVVARLKDNPALKAFANDREPILLVINGETERIRAASRTRLTSLVLDGLLAGAAAQKQPASSKTLVTKMRADAASH